MPTKMPVVEHVLSELPQLGEIALDSSSRATLEARLAALAEERHNLRAELLEGLSPEEARKAVKEHLEIAEFEVESYRMILRMTERSEGGTSP